MRATGGVPPTSQNPFAENERLAKRDILFGCFAVVLLFLLALFVANHTVVVSIIAGALTGIFESLIMFPLENLKIQEQLDGTDMRHAFRRTWAAHGLAGLYKGLWPVLVGAVPTQAIRWGTYEAFCAVTDCSLLSNVALGGIITAIANSLLTGVPIETLKTSIIHNYVATSHSRMQSADSQSEGIECAHTHVPIVAGASPISTKDLYPSILSSSEGPPLVSRVMRRSYRGWFPTLLKKIINQAIRFPMHAWFLGILCAWTVASDMGGGGSSPTTQIGGGAPLLRSTPCKHNHPVINFIAGCFAGLSSILITQPIDVAKTRMQGNHGHRFRHMFHCIQSIFVEDGCRAFSHGLISRTLRATLGAGITFALFPFFQAFITHHWLGSSR